MDWKREELGKLSHADPEGMLPLSARLSIYATRTQRTPGEGSSSWLECFSPVGIWTTHLLLAGWYQSVRMYEAGLGIPLRMPPSDFALYFCCPFCCPLPLHASSIYCLLRSALVVG